MPGRHTQYWITTMPGNVLLPAATVGEAAFQTLPDVFNAAPQPGAGIILRVVQGGLGCV